MLDTLSREIDRLLQAPHCFLDTETTGLDHTAEVIEIAIIGPSGETLFESLCKPKRPIPADASRIHGITNKDVSNSPRFIEVFTSVLGAVQNRTVFIYNADYDLRLIRQSIRPIGFSMKHFCAMQSYAVFHGDWSNYHQSFKWQPLTSAAHACYVQPQGQAHRAKTDALMCRGVVHWMANYHKNGDSK